MVIWHLASNQYSKAKRLNPAVCGSGLFMQLSSRIRYIMNCFEMPCHPTVLICAEAVCYPPLRCFFTGHAESVDVVARGAVPSGTNGRRKVHCCRTPCIDEKSGPKRSWDSYDPALIIRAQSLLLEDADKLSASALSFRSCRCTTADDDNLGQLIHRKAAEAFRSKDRELYTSFGNVFSGMLADMDTFVAYTKRIYSFDRWLTEARSWERRKRKIRWNDATSLVTICCTDGIYAYFDYSWRNGPDW